MTGVTNAGQTPRGVCGKRWGRLSTERTLLAAGPCTDTLLPSPSTSPFLCLQPTPRSVSSTQTFTNYGLFRSPNPHLQLFAPKSKLKSKSLSAFTWQHVPPDGTGLTMGRQLQFAVTWHRTNDDFWVLRMTFDALDKNLGTSLLSLSLLRVKEGGLALSQQRLP